MTDYQRVRIDSDIPLLVNEAAAGDLVHMVTELVDNSLSYSSPQTSVVLDAADSSVLYSKQAQSPVPIASLLPARR